jgi:hypothetical protein
MRVNGWRHCTSYPSYPPIGPNGTAASWGQPGHIMGMSPCVDGFEGPIPLRKGDEVRGAGGARAGCCWGVFLAAGIYFFRRPIWTSRSF